MGLTITEARRRLTELIHRAAAGEEISIGRHGRDEVVLIGSAKLANLRRQLGETEPVETLAQEIGPVWERAIEALGSEARAVSWLCRANRGLQGRTPREVVRTDMETVLRILGRAEHGVF